MQVGGTYKRLEGKVRRTSMALTRQCRKKRNIAFDARARSAHPHPPDEELNTLF